jgi:hypothetical protein
MIRLGLRLAVTGGREAVVRLVIITAAVALGVGMLLSILAAINAVQKQGDRYAILNTSPATRAKPGADPLWWAQRHDIYNRTAIDRIDVAALGPNSPVPPGIPRLPGPGEYYASPALAELLATVPADQLGDRYPGHQIGTIGRAALPSPRHLMIIVGQSPDAVAGIEDAIKVSGIETEAPEVWLAALNLILAVTGAGLLFPVLIFIGTATRLTATRREQRFAAMRLIGATPKQISVIAAAEATMAAIAGTAVGFVLYQLMHGWLVGIPFTGEVFFPNEVTLNVLDVLGVVIGVPIAAAVAARVALRRVRISPLGVTRRVTPKPPRAYRLLVIVAGLAELAYFVPNQPDTGVGQTMAYLPGLLLIMTGLIVAGPWFTMVGARMLARRANRPAALISSRRLADNPQAAFRAISGVVMALFVTTVAIGVITTIVANRGSHVGPSDRRVMFAYFGGEEVVDVPAAVTADLAAVPGGGQPLVMRENPLDRDHRTYRYGPGPELVLCADLARAGGLGHCADGVQVGALWAADPHPPAVVPAATISADELKAMPVEAMLIQTDGQPASLERVRTIMVTAFPNRGVPPLAAGDWEADFLTTLNGWKRLANVIVLASLPVAGCSLAVSVAGGLSDRKRPFSLLRLSGVQLRVLRRVVALESAVPLLLVAVVAIAAGLATAYLFLEAQMHYRLILPGAGFWLLIGGSLVAALAVIASTLPLLERITGPEAARNG